MHVSSSVQIYQVVVNGSLNFNLSLEKQKSSSFEVKLRFFFHSTFVDFTHLNSSHSFHLLKLNRSLLVNLLKIKDRVLLVDARALVCRFDLGPTAHVVHASTDLGHQGEHCVLEDQEDDKHKEES